MPGRLAAARARALALLFAAVCAFSAFAVPAQAAQRTPPLVLAAASLQDSLSAAADAWARRGHPRPVLSFAASSALARQAAAGAPADLFLSADQEWMDYLAARGRLVPGTRTTVAGNALVLIAPVASRTALRIGRGFPLAEALGSGRLAMADPANVPAGKYGREALTRLGVWARVRGRVAAADNVRSALMLVARREAPLGIVYATDARASRDVRIVGVFPAASHARIVYPLARLKGSENPEAEAFRRYLLSPEARGIFRRFGFTAG